MIKSIHQITYEIFCNHPDMIFSTRDISIILLHKYRRDVKKNIITTILIRLYRERLIDRTQTQLADGHHYSLRNKKCLDKIYNNHLIPYTIINKQELIKKIIRVSHPPLRINEKPDKKSLIQQDFTGEYPDEIIDSPSTHIFLACLTGFIMCDGHICNRLYKVNFFFRQESDAKSFINNFKQVFCKESLIHRKNTVGNSYVVEIRKAAKLARFLHHLGAPKGNKTKQPFLIPDWIYHGPDEIKKIFISTVIGNEGSAPSNRRWRIQFVLSKFEEHITNLIEFLNQIRAMLNHFGITTSHIQLRNQPGRQFHGRFYIKGEENLHKFYKQFEFSYASEKQEVLEELISTAPLRSEMCCDLVNTR